MFSIDIFSFLICQELKINFLNDRSRRTAAPDADESPRISRPACRSHRSQKLVRPETWRNESERACAETKGALGRLLARSARREQRTCRDTFCRMPEPV